MSVRMIAENRRKPSRARQLVSDEERRRYNALLENRMERIRRAQVFQTREIVTFRNGTQLL